MAVRRRVFVLLVIGLITAGLTPFAFQLQYDDDVIQFLPEGDEEVERFRSIGERFHGLNIGIIGVEVPDGDIFEGRHLELIRILSREIPGFFFFVSFST